VKFGYILALQYTSIHYDFPLYDNIQTTSEGFPDILFGGYLLVRTMMHTFAVRSVRTHVQNLPNSFDPFVVYSILNRFC
jgi:hypothetical protein